MTRIFEPAVTPRIFATALGVDFCAALIAGLDARLEGQPPEAIARVEVHVANARMQRRLQALYLARGAGFLPRIRTVAALSEAGDLAGLPPAMPPLRLRLKLADLVRRLIDSDPELAPRAAIYPLADSLADLMGEMFEERVTPEMIAALDMGTQSRHWARSQAVLAVVEEFFGADAALTGEARQAQLVDRLSRQWAEAPPEHPVIVAGSTGSRGATARLMQAVARLPQGAVVLPGLDRDMPQEIWARLLDERRRAGLGGEDHPQYRLARVAEAAGLAPAEIPEWAPAMEPASAARNAMVSLALRPAPVTDQWREEGPKLADLPDALARVTLLEAPSPQTEATAIALGLREAAERGIRAALVSPDRVLTRQVAAALDRWGILPDDSGGEPLGLTTPGRFLRMVAEAQCGPMDAEMLVALLSHPLCHSGVERGPHLRFSREFELDALRGRVAFAVPATLADWAAARTGADRDEALAWAGWVASVLLGPRHTAPLPFADRVAAHVAMAEALAAGPGQDGSGGLYDKDAGEAAAKLVSDLTVEAGSGGLMNARDYADFFTALAADREARSVLRPHALIQVWGTLEARVQGADLLILAGLNEGAWPAAPKADPWLNRPLRDTAGLRLPDRVIGLSAHDFQQAIAAPEVWICRARRDAETDTVASRWLNRITNLLEGASETSKAALEQMRNRGECWIALAEAVLRPAAHVPAAPRPAPAPPVAARPRQISVTEVETLIRDPYAVYARRVLGLRPLDPLRPQPDAAGRGSTLHDILDRFCAAFPDTLPKDAEAELLRIADAVLEDAAPWPAARRLWHARLARVAPWFLSTEAERRDFAASWLREARGAWALPGLGVTLVGKADRIDRLPDGRVAIYDYKSGKPPTEKEERAFSKQLWLEAAMAAEGAFGEEGPLQTARIAYIGLGAQPEIIAHDPAPSDLAEITGGFRRLIGHFLSPSKGYPSRRALKNVRWSGDYDQLARYGEWDETEDAVLLPVGDAEGGGS
ncbi:double-strand break repair protein AddB [Roseibacterium sp. SDUM158016]|uniref:double-strand break repair protein AddB n=1 Tax=Roseicyclus sediminis TaxID=2980997 RepID=UPI0021D20B62|nr:double-strand break repair protein AddB [Roseibacterium sp. SDUM158016]MCU4652482.1 double-strand break repair protein AddB [Roseibacterium sp. SDUM158016]